MNRSDPSAKRPAAQPVILFGAFDRHNFGDLLFPHVVAQLVAPRPVRYAGLAARDMRPFGGHLVETLPEAVRALDGQPATLIHAGGELLTCDAWQAAVMLLDPREAAAIIARYADRPAQAQGWARRHVALDGMAPYTVPRAQLPPHSSILYNAVGGVDLAAGEPALRNEVLAKLRDADYVSVRDSVTRDTLQAAGIDAALAPDPALLAGQLFGDRIRAHGAAGEPARIRTAFAGGYVAAQFSTEFGDDATLRVIARELDRHAADSGQGIAFFRAGAAPWHDELELYRRTASQMRTPAAIMESLQLWDICALIAGSRAIVGSSLHGRIVAMAFGLPRAGLAPPGQCERVCKHEAFARSWDLPGMPLVCDPQQIAHALASAAAIPRGRMAEWAEKLTLQCSDFARKV